ncbi:MAG TPA: hypothetical protein VJ851_04650 [Jatrophihabitans sp.]|nr:hypothetical protein [Jatrophihabitans sp.]
MAWLWWLLAPVASTGVGAGLLCWRSWREPGSSSRPSRAMREHRAVLQALSRSQPADAAPVPVTMRVLEVAQAD